MNSLKLWPTAFITGLLQVTVKASVKRDFPPNTTATPPPSIIGNEIDSSSSHKDISPLLLSICLGSSLLVILLFAILYFLLSRRKNKVFPMPIKDHNLPCDKETNDVSEKHFKEMMTIMDAEEGYSASLHSPPNHVLSSTLVSPPPTKTAHPAMTIPRPVKDGSWRLSRLKLGTKFDGNSPTGKFLRDSYQVW
ncbi:hypothetical protein K7432_005680 [Basidiobolus ranarum]|uniref:Uncharacterized protein n=1 Tax=Basidiobolus ranarum TaxID=34480 RepID=A0ABR2WW99_9FUNG